MDIEGVAETNTHWIIYRDDGFIETQRKYCLDATDNPLDGNEEMICALCRDIKATLDAKILSGS